jgi:dipeptidyl aminopeptidase/acylaminoacyl peptidase
MFILMAASLVLSADPIQKPAAEAKKPVVAKAPILSAEQAIAVRRLADLQLSPDGKRLTFAVNRPPKGTDHGQEIWMLDVQSHRLWRFAHSSKSDRRPRWAPDGSRLAFLSDRKERAQIYLIPNDGGEAERLTEGENAVTSFEWSPDGKHIAFMAQDPKTEEEKKKDKDKDDARVVDVDDKPVRLWVVEVASKKVRKVAQTNFDVESVQWAPKGDRLFITALAHPKTLEARTFIYTVALADGKLNEVHVADGRVGDLKVSPEGTRLSFIGPREDGPSPHDLFLLSAAGGQPQNITAARLDRPIQATTWRKDGKLLVVSVDGVHSRLLTIATDGTITPLDGTTVNPSDPAAWTESLVAFVGQTASELPEVYLWRTGSPAECVTDFNKSFRTLGLVKPEFFRYTSFDKTEIEALLYRPKELAAGKRAPLFVHVHGGPTGAFVDGFDAWSQLLVARGYAVFCPNVRGSTGYGWSFLTKNRADWGGGDFKDVMAGVDDLIQRGIADPNRLAVGGWSYGGYMSAWAITQTPRFKAAVVGACMSDLASEFGTENTDTAQYDRWFNGLPYEKFDTYIKSSPVSHVKKARTPALILHGENDAIDPIGQGQQFYRGLKHYGVPCEFVLYPREGHGPQEEKHQIDVLQRVVRWCDSHVKDSPQAEKAGN